MRVVVFPLLRRNWVFHTVPCVQAASKSNGASATTANAGGAEKQGWSEAVQQKVNRMAQNEWHRMEKASKRSLRGVTYRFAQWVLSKRDPMATFLGSIPQDTERLEVIFPGGIPERMVRRRLRMLATQRRKELRSQMMKWWGATAASIPLFILPVTNLPLYWAVYQLHISRKAVRGAKKLEDLILEWERERWGEAIPLERLPQAKEEARRLDGSLQYKASEVLTGLVDLKARREMALSDAAVSSIGEEFGGKDELLELVQRTRRLGWARDVHEAPDSASGSTPVT